MHTIDLGGAALMTAMMLPAAIPACLRRIHDSVSAAALFALAYLAAWSAFGIAVSVLLPHGMLIAGGVMVAACIFELTPLTARRQVR
jgi:predicted metal-binding membrane protein